MQRVTLASESPCGTLEPGVRGIAVEQHGSFGEALASAFRVPGGELLVLHGDRVQCHPLSRVPSIPAGAAAAVLLCTDRFDPSPLRIFTSPDGTIERIGDAGAAPMTNLADSGAWLAAPCIADACREAASPVNALLAMMASGTRVAGEIAPGYTRSLESREGFLLACHEMLSGRVPGTCTEPPPPDGVLVEEGSGVGQGTLLSGTAWLQAGSRVGAGCLLENCVLLAGSSVGDGCRLRNTLVEREACIPPGTQDFDKYLKIRERNSP